MKLEGWVEIAVGTVILGTLGYVAVKVIDTSERIGAVDGKLGSVDTKVTFTSDRVERIANALPEMRIHIAEDEIKRQIKTAVVSTKPTQSADGKWKVIVNVIDPVASARWTFPVSLPSRDDRSALYSLIGTGADADTTYMSAAELRQFIRGTKVDISLPSYIDERASFVLHDTTADEYIAKITAFEHAVRKTDLTVPTDDWTKLTKLLESDPDMFKKQ